MTDPYIKAIPNEETGHLTFVMDQAGYEMFDRLLRRAQPTRSDSPATFKHVKDRISGAFMAGAAVMGWTRK